MKIKMYYLLIFVLFCSTSSLLSQTLSEEHAPPEAFSASDPILDYWDNYFNENFFQKGYAIEDIAKEGTGYLPFLRAQLFYDARKNHQGELSTKKLWELHKQSKQQLLDRGGLTPVADWQSVGPNKMDFNGGRMISHAFDPTNSEIIWAGAASGGLWRSENGGGSWESMSDEIPSTGVGAIAINPQNRNSMLMGTGEGYFVGVSVRPGIGVFKSHDRGLTWEETFFQFQQSVGVSAFKIIWHPVDTNIVFMAATNGVWKSNDAGQSWDLKYGNGTNWQFIADDLVMDTNNPDVLYTAIENDGIYKTTDGGDNWTRLNTGLPAAGSVNFISLDICRDFPNVLYTSMAKASDFSLEGLFKSEDNGATWTKLTQTPNAFCPPPPFNYACQGFYDNTVGVSPTDPNHVLIGGITFWNSIDGGANWTQHDTYVCPTCPGLPPGATFVDHHDIGFDPNNSDIIYNFSDGGVAKSINGGTYWTPMNEGLITAQFYAITSAKTNHNIWSGGFQDHGLQATNLASFADKQWKKWGFLDGTGVEIDHTNPFILYGTWLDGQILKNPSGINTAGTFFINNGIPASERVFQARHALQMDPVDPTVLYYASGLKIYKTTNGGIQWQAIANIPNVSVIEVDLNDPNYVYAASWDQQGNWGFWRSINGGQNWSLTLQFPGWRVTDIESDPNNPGVVYATRNSAFPNNSHVYKSTDWGNTWTSIQNNLPDITVNAMAINAYDGNCLYLATDLGVYISTDGGGEWLEYNDGMPVTFAMDIHYHPLDTTLRIGTLGRGAWKTKSLPGDSQTSVDEIEHARFSLGQPFPNPATQEVNLSYELKELSEVKVEVLNYSGQLVDVLWNGIQQAGNQTIKWDLRNEIGLKVSSGAYFICVVVNGFRGTKKVIVK